PQARTRRRRQRLASRGDRQGREPLLASLVGEAFMSTETLPRFDAVEHHPDDAVTAYTYFPPTEETMRALAQELFATHWRSIVVGPCIEGAVFEVSFQSPPEIRYADGYLTVDLGPWHFHLCLGPHRGSSSDELRRNRPVAKAAFFERRGKGCAGG